MNKKLLFSLFVSFALAFSSKAQLVVTPGGGVGAVASAIGGTGLTISNVTISCNNASYGSFSGGASSGMGISTGLALTTGTLANLPGTGNVNDDFNSCIGTSANDPQLTALSASATNDVCIIEFDVVPQCTSMGITFVFGSDEYTNWINQTFNDAFGFFVTGPNPGGGSYTNRNIAVLPSGTNVSVDNVNNVTNPAYFVNNNSGTYANHFDGFTTVLTPSIAVTPCATYHVKLAIADASDCQMDSGVLINVIQCNNVTTLSTSNTPATACGSNNGTATVSVTNGLPPLTYNWSPAPGGGQGTPTATGLAPGTYTVTVDDSYACIPPVTATVTIGGAAAPTVAVSSSSVCNGATASLTATPSTGGGTYAWSPGGATTQTISINPSATTTYTCSYTLSGCTGTSTGTVTVNPQPNITPVAPVCSGVAPFNLAVDVTGGGWSGTGITNASAGTFSPAAATTGTNVITYSASGGCNDTIHITVTPGASPTWTQPTPMCVADGPINLSSLVTGTSGGTFSGSGVSANTFDPAGLSGSIPVTYTVGSSPCVATSTLNISVSPNTPPVITAVSPVCASASAFNLSASIPGGTWSGTGITNASAGTFNPAAASSGSNQIIYMVSGSCAGSDTIQLTVNPASNAAWTAPAPMCANNATINLDSLITGTTGGTWTGSGVTGHSFNPSGLSGSIAVTYTVGTACPDTLVQNITVTPTANPAWTSTTLCASGASINLDSLVTGTTGGTWSGTGVSGSTFNPSGLSGNIAVTYTVGTAPCVATSMQNISVIVTPNPTWTSASVCSSAGAINLDSLVTGTTGGTWSGTGVTGHTFNPSGLSGTISVTYTVGATGCMANSAQNMTVIPAANPAWTTTAVCASASSSVNLNTLVTGTAGGTWSGTGVTGSTFNPSGLSGPIAVTYTVGSAPCISTSTQNITVAPVANAAWTSTTMCANATPVNLDALVTGTSGGTWSGTGVTGSTFNPSGLSGTIAVTYTVGTSPCTATSTQNITVTPNANATITSVSALCANGSPITLSAANPGGTWSGTGITNPATGTFNPATATAGTHVITYSIAGACGDTDTVTVTVNPTPNAAWAMQDSICANATPVNLNSLVTGASGGTWSGAGVTGSTFDPSGMFGTTTVTYTVTQSGCTSSVTEVIDVDDVNASFTATPTSGQAPVTVTTLNGSTNAASYAWTFGNGQTSAANNPSMTYNSYGNYPIILTATSSSGCVDVAEVIIHVDEQSALVIPNVFTPNGDGSNDVFYPVVEKGLSDFKAVVYDRWGLKMHEWADAAAGWDGKSKNGAEAPDGTYYYIITGKGVDGKDYNFTGFITLLRK